MANHTDDKELMRIGAFYVIVLLFGISAWFILDPIDLRSQIDRFLLVPLITAFAAGVLALLLWERLFKR